MMSTRAGCDLLSQRWQREFRHRALRFPFDETRRDEWRVQLRGELARVLALGYPSHEDGTPQPVVGWEEQRGSLAAKVLHWSRQVGGAGDSLWISGGATRDKRALVLLLPDSPAGKAECAGWLATGSGIDLAWSLAEVGYLVCVPDLAGNGPEAADAQAAARWGLLVGRPLLGLQVQDALQWASYAAQHSQVDPTRLGIVGFGNGALVGLLAAALDERFHCAVLSGFFGTWETVLVSPLAQDHWLVPDLPWLAEISDLLQLVAPRFLFIEIGKQDQLCPLAIARQVWLKVKYGYDLMGAGDAVDWEVFDGGHRFWGRGALVWLRHHLKTWGGTRP